MRILVAAPPKTGNVWIDQLLQRHVRAAAARAPRPPSVDAEFLEWARASSPTTRSSTSTTGRASGSSPRATSSTRRSSPRFATRTTSSCRCTSTCSASPGPVPQQHRTRRSRWSDVPIDDPAVIDFVRTGFRSNLEIGTAWLASGPVDDRALRGADREPGGKRCSALADQPRARRSSTSSADAIEDAKPDRMRTMNKHVHAHIRSATVGRRLSFLRYRSDKRTRRRLRVRANPPCRATEDRQRLDRAAAQRHVRVADCSTPRPPRRPTPTSSSGHETEFPDGSIVHQHYWPNDRDPRRVTDELDAKLVTSLRSPVRPVRVAVLLRPALRRASSATSSNPVHEMVGRAIDDPVVIDYIRHGLPARTSRSARQWLASGAVDDHPLRGADRRARRRALLGLADQLRARPTSIGVRDGHRRTRSPIGCERETSTSTPTSDRRPRATGAIT